MKKARINEMWGVFFLLVGLFTLASILFYHPDDLPFFTSHPNVPLRNYTGIVGAYVAFGLKITFGASAILIPGLFLLWAACFFMQRVPDRKLFKFAGLGIALTATSILVAVSVDQDLRLEQAGFIGYLIGSHLLNYLGQVGSYILAGACLLLALLLATDFLIYPMAKTIAKFFTSTLENIWEGLITFQEWCIEQFGPQGDSRSRAQRADKAIKVSTKEMKTRLKEIESDKPSKKSLIEMNSTMDRDTPVKVKRYNPIAAMEEAAAAAEKENAAAAKSKKEEKPVPAAPKETLEENRKRIKEAAASKEKDKDKDPESHEGVVGSGPIAVNYQFPALDFLKKPEKSEALPDNLQENSRILEDTLAEFGIEVKVVEVEQGPVITRYELMPAPGVKVNSIAALSDDIALALKAASVRLIIPIPGKSAVGVEVPNSKASKVFFRELVELPILKAKKQALPLLLGKDTSGKPLVADLSGMPHILIAGTTGSGKTVCVNSIILGLLYSLSPDELKFVMVDPKMVELSVYNKIPHMLSPVVTDVRKAAHTLNWVVSEMENRYRLLATVGVRNIQAFNARPLSPEAVEATAGVESENVIPAKLPYIVVVIDELADLMMVAQDKVEGAITRLAQLSRAVGIHLILATQRPSVDVITGVIKANFPARISFKVASKVDSRTVLDAVGADKLIGKGDMLFLQPGTEKLIRGQAAFVGDDEINAVVGFVSAQAKPQFHPEIQALQEGKKSADGAQEKDELFDEAVNIVLQTGQASTSNLQRRLGLGYTRAARIIDQMEAEGIIGPTQGAKPREILVSRNQTPQTVASDTADETE